MTARVLLAAALLAAPTAAADPPLAGAVIVVDPGHGGQRYSKSYTGGTRGVASEADRERAEPPGGPRAGEAAEGEGGDRPPDPRGRPPAQPRGVEQRRRVARPDRLLRAPQLPLLPVRPPQRRAGRPPPGTPPCTSTTPPTTPCTRRWPGRSTTPWRGPSRGRSSSSSRAATTSSARPPIPGTIAESGFMTNRDVRRTRRTGRTTRRRRRRRSQGGGQVLDRPQGRAGRPAGEAGEGAGGEAARPEDVHGDRR